MKRIVGIVTLLLFFSGCHADADIQHILELRNDINNATQCSFDAVISADYGDVIYTFQMACIYTRQKEMSFTVTDPASIAGISGVISGNEAFLTFDDHVISFPPLADGQITPVTAPWIFIETLHGGYISSSCIDGDDLQFTIDDSYEENPILLDIWLDTDNSPIHCDILYLGKRILSLDIKNFTLS